MLPVSAFLPSPCQEEHFTCGWIFSQSICRSRSKYLVFPSSSFLLLLDEIGRRRRRWSCPHAANDSNAVLRERGETQLLAFTDLYALKLLKPSERELKHRWEEDCTTSCFFVDQIPFLKTQFNCFLSRSDQYALPQQQEDLLHWKVRRMAAAELGNHTKEHDRDGLVVEKRRTWMLTADLNKPKYQTLFHIKLTRLQSYEEYLPSSALKVSLKIFHSGLLAGSSCWIVSTIKYIMLRSTLRSVLSAREMAGFLTALLQAALLLKSRRQIKDFLHKINLLETSQSKEQVYLLVFLIAMQQNSVFSSWITILSNQSYKIQV